MCSYFKLQFCWQNTYNKEGLHTQHAGHDFIDGCIALKSFDEDTEFTAFPGNRLKKHGRLTERQRVFGVEINEKTVAILAFKNFYVYRYNWLNFDGCLVPRTSARTLQIVCQNCFSSFNNKWMKWIISIAYCIHITVVREKYKIKLFIVIYH